MNGGPGKRAAGRPGAAPVGVARVAAAPAAALLVAAVVLAPGCTRLSELPVPGLYRLDIRQGNALDDTALAKLEVGMPRSRVLHLLGSPAVDDVFHPDRWEYLYSFAPGGEESEWRRITLHFEENRLTRIEGELPPADAAPTEPEAAKVVRVPPRPAEKGFLRRALRKVKGDR